MGPCTRLRWRAVLVALLAFRIVQGFSWGDHHAGSKDRNGGRTTVSGALLSPSELLRSKSRLQNIYTTALNELEELESEPMCHRIAARLLVNNCQLLDGKDDATVLTDSGTRARDFVDSYAASLAICDLERGHFSIPSACAKFQESTLGRLSVPERPLLHVTSKEIDLCLTGLAESDSAWGTWVSYRHKALRFCEAARADNEKAHSVLLYQRITKVLANLTDGVEAELEKYLHSLDTRAREASENLASLEPQIDRLRSGLGTVEEILTSDLSHIIQTSSDAMQSSLESARNLQQVLTVLLKTVLENNAEVSASSELTVQTVTQRAASEMGIVITALTAAVASSASLQSQIDLSKVQAEELAHRQERLEMGMGRLANLTDDLSSKYQSHSEHLDEAQERTTNILDTLEEASKSVTTMRSAIYDHSGLAGWLLYVVCPAASLVMGSYGLKPSAIRNLALVALGELVGLSVSIVNRYGGNLFPPSKAGLQTAVAFANNTLTLASLRTTFDEVSSVNFQ